VHDALAARVPDVADRGALGERSATAFESGRGAVQVTVEDDVVPKPASLAERVLGDDARAEELSDEDHLGVPLLMFEGDDLDLGPAWSGKIDASVPDMRELAPSALFALGQVEIVTAHRELHALRNGNRIAVRLVFGGAIRAAGNLIVGAEVPLLVVVRRAECDELVTPLVVLRRNGDAHIVVGQASRRAHSGQADRRAFSARRPRVRHRIRRAGRSCAGPASQSEDSERSHRGANQRVHLGIEYDTSFPMAPPPKDAIEAVLSELFQAQRKTRHLAEEIAAGPTEIVLLVLADAIAGARAHRKEEDRVLELESISQILGQLPGPRAVDALVDILGSEESAARHAAGLVLEEIAYERFKEVALGIERALEKLPNDHLALTELPYLLIEIPEPGALKLVHRFLEHPNEEVVAAAIEAAVEIGDPASAQKLARLEKDARLVELDEEEETGGEASVTIGELAKEARLMLETLGSEENP
jgi:hypothetical protein